MTILDTTVDTPDESDEGMDGRSHSDTQRRLASILFIRELQSERVHTIKSRLRIDNQARARVRRCLGYHAGMDKAEREKVSALAEKIIAAIQKGKVAPAGEEEVVKAVSAFVLVTKDARGPFIEYQKKLDRDMTKEGVLLSVWPWVEAINGFGALGLAQIIGECGDLSNYANPAKVWKRLGLAVIDGKRQGSPGDDATKQDWITHGYCRRRRAIMWVIGDSLITKQNAYRDLYVERKAFEAQRDPEMSKMHAHRRAQRYMEKRLLRDLWRAWRDAEGDQ